MCSVPHLSELKNACAQPIIDYRACLDKHSSLPDEEVAERCGGLMTELWKCSERAMASIEARQGGSSGTTGTASSGRLV